MMILSTCLLDHPTLFYNHVRLISPSNHIPKNEIFQQVLDQHVNHYDLQKLMVSIFVMLKTLGFVVNLDESYQSSSTPIVAVRRVVNTLIAQRTKELEKINSQPKPLRAKRLENRTGVNITDDEFLMKMKENEEKKQRKQKPQSPKLPNAQSTISSTPKVVAKRRGRPPKKTTNNSHQQVYSNDSEVQAGIFSLQSAIKMANSILDTDDSDEEWT